MSVRICRGWLQPSSVEGRRLVRSLSECGYSLVEPMTALAVLGVLSAIAVPSFARLLAETRVRDASSDLFAAVIQTRSEALKRHGRAVLCKSADLNRCIDDIRWDSGWIVFNDENESGQRDADEALLRTGEARGGRVTISGDGSVGNYVSYVGSGRTQQLNTGAWQAGTLTVCSEGIARQIIINRVGRPRTVPATC